RRKLMENNAPAMGSTAPERDGQQKALATKEPSALAKIFGHFTRKEFWIDLFEMVVKNATTAFFIAVGKSLVEYGRKKGGASAELDLSMDAKPVQSPAAQAFSRGYSPSTSYSAGAYAPVPVNNDQPSSFPGFGSR